MFTKSLVLVFACLSVLASLVIFISYGVGVSAKVEARSSSATTVIANDVAIVALTTPLITTLANAPIADPSTGNRVATPTLISTSDATQGTSKSPLTEKNQLLEVEQSLGDKNSKIFKQDGWYLLSYITYESQPSVVIAPSTQTQLTAARERFNKWFYVKNGKITDNLVLTYATDNNRLLQVAVGHDGTAVNLTGYNDETMRSTAIFADSNYGQQVRKISGVGELLKTMPQNTKFKAWKEKANYHIHTTQPPATDGTSIEYQFVYEYETGKVLRWQAGLRSGATFQPQLDLTDLKIEFQPVLPTEINELFEQGKSILGGY